jgi:opacity protein-like surface antigen
MKLFTAVLIAGALLISSRANAQVTPGTQQAAFDLGLANPLSNESLYGPNEAFGQPGPAFGFSYLYQLKSHLAFGGDLNFKSLGSRNFNTPYGPVDFHSSAATLLAVARGDLLPDNNVRPYGLVGLGIGRVRREADFYQNPGFGTVETSGGLAFALGGGVDYDFNKAWLAGAELRYTIIGTNPSYVGSNSVSTLDILFKVGYKF